MAAIKSRYVVCGNPVAHSQSPFIHAAFAAQTGEPVVYDRLLCAHDAFAATVRAFAAGGGSGCNVTMPFKFDAWALADRHSARARLAGACNVLRFDADGWFGDNTDGAGLVRDIERNAGVALAGALVARHAQALGGIVPARVAATALEDCGNAFDVVVNASASSVSGAAVPVAASVLKRGALAFDMMYGAAARPFLDWATAHGAIGRDGLGMLVEQAAEAFFLWRGVEPETAPVLLALRERIASA
jgi:shikimate dehydrogenase